MSCSGEIYYGEHYRMKIDTKLPIESYEILL
eukprot:SAG31_NODE_26910_length_434_cov_0.928358_1_plen_30_part_10